jgi:hypothetical protein
MSNLEDRLDHDYAPAWKPRPGEKVVGRVLAIETIPGQYGAYPVVTLSTDDGEVAIHAFHAVLKSELARQKPQPGDRLGCKYIGRDAEKGYEKYRLIVESARSEPIDWNRIGAEAEEELTSGTRSSASSESLPDEPPFPDEAPF